jgi:hypothetical protein
LVAGGGLAQGTSQKKSGDKNNTHQGSLSEALLSSQARFVAKCFDSVEFFHSFMAAFSGLMFIDSCGVRKEEERLIRMQCFVLLG